MQPWSSDHCRCGSKSDQQQRKCFESWKIAQNCCRFLSTVHISTSITLSGSDFAKAILTRNTDLALIHFKRLLTRTMASGITVVNMARPTTKNMIWNILKLWVTITINHKWVLQYLYGSWELRPSYLGHRIDIAIAHCRHCHNHAIYTPECRLLVSRSVIILYSKNKRKIFFPPKIRKNIFSQKNKKTRCFTQSRRGSGCWWNPEDHRSFLQSGISMELF